MGGLLIRNQRILDFMVDAQGGKAVDDVADGKTSSRVKG